MSDHSPEDLSREIDRLWARVGSAMPEATSVAAISATTATSSVVGAEVAWETVGLLKRQMRQSESSWRQTMDARDEAMRVLRARLESAENELSGLRAHADNEDQRILVDTLDAREKVETAQKALNLAQARYNDERRILEEAMQSLRERLAAENSRSRSTEARWQSREQQYVIDLQELQNIAARREKEAAQAQSAARALQNNLAEAKNALEKTLAELLLERKERERAHGEREAAQKNVAELRTHVDELSKIWEEERAQWKELWDRERASWESRRAELAKWEEDLRREREAWHAELKVKEAAHLAITDDLSGKIRETAQNAEKMTELIETFDRKTTDDTHRAAESLVAMAANERSRQRRVRRWATFVVTVVIAGAAFIPVQRAAQTWRYTAESGTPAPVPNPSAMGFDGDLLWIADWGGRLVGVDPADPRRVLRQANPAPAGPYHPTAIAAGGGLLWTLDAAQPRLLRHSAGNPEKILSVRPSPGAAPTALAYDGETVWSYDAVDHALTRHGGDDAPAQKFAFPDDAVPNAMAWSRGRLWVHDAKGHRILVYSVDGARLCRVDMAPAPEAGALGMVVADGASARERRVRFLLGPTGARLAAEVVRYRIRRWLPFAHY